MFSFKLSDDFVNQFKDRQPDWGFQDAGGNALGEIAFIRTYSRVKEDGTKERWYEVCRRVIEGMYSIQKDWAKERHLPWNDHKAQRSAQEAYERMFLLKWTPPGRGLFVMGTEFVMGRKNSAALQNCANVSTKDIDRNNPGELFAWVMDALMLGVGVGFDTQGRHKGIKIVEPAGEVVTYVVPDSREGWAESVRLLINSYLKKNEQPLAFDYSLVRPAGEPIRGFGGVASGPGPLITLHEKIREVIGGRTGEEFDSRAIVDLVNLIGTCVVAGNVRRSATLALGEHDDKDFLHLKDSSVFPERNSYDPENPGWAWMSNNSLDVTVGTNYEDYIDRIVANGEPGLIWLDVARNFGRIEDGPDGKDYRVMGFNPCVAGDTWVQTSNGPRRVTELLDSPFEAVVDGKPYASTAFWKTGEKEVFDVITDAGYVVKATADHKILTARGWLEVNDLTTEDELVLHDHVGSEWAGNGSFEDGYVVGHWLGDGTISEGRVVLEDWNESDPSATLIASKAFELPHRSDFNGWTNVPSRNSRRISSSGLSQHVFSWTKSKSVTDEIEKSSSDFYKGFLSGWFDTDGHVEGTSTRGGVTVRLSSVDRESLLAGQRMLARLGIISTIRDARDEGVSLLPDGNGGKKEYKTQRSYRLIIAGKHTQRFAEIVGFVNPHKRAKLNNAIDNMTRGFYDKPIRSRVLSITSAGVEEVYDATVQDVHAFDANGIYVHNCAEQPLESFEMCTLVEVHLNKHQNKEDFLRTLKFAYLYGKTVTLLPTHWERTNAVMQRNRRIGTSLTGIANFADYNGLPTVRDWMDDGYEKIRYYDNKYSEWLGIRESIRVTTVKPSGTVSLLSGASPGVHWSVGGEFFMRTIRFASTDPMLTLFEFAGYRIEDDLVSANTKVVYFPVYSGHARSEKDVTLFEKFGMAATAQRYWSDNGVSVTLSFDRESEKQHIAAGLHMFEGGLKAVSFLPMDNDVYPQQPYTQITREEYNRYVGQIAKIDFGAIYDGHDNIQAEGEKYCTTEGCEIYIAK